MNKLLPLPLGFTLALMSLIIGFGLGFYIIDVGFYQFGAVSSSEGKEVGFYALAFFLLFVGIFGGAAYKHAAELAKTGVTRIDNYKEFFTGIVRSLDFAVSLIGAPLIFALIIEQIASVSLPGMSVIALQNGFASTAIIGSIMGNGNVKKANPINHD